MKINGLEIDSTIISELKYQTKSHCNNYYRKHGKYLIKLNIFPKELEKLFSTNKLLT
jgi:hypothetical protein